MRDLSAAEPASSAAPRPMIRERDLATRWRLDERIASAASVSARERLPRAVSATA
jgi:hypothetical protein